MKYFAYILLGFLIGLINYSLLIFTVKILKESKKLYVTLISYYFRIIITISLIFLFAGRNIQSLFLMLFGFFISKILSIILVKKNKIKI